MMGVEDFHGEERDPKSPGQVIFWIVLMNVVFSFDSILSALAHPRFERGKGSPNPVAVPLARAGALGALLLGLFSAGCEAPAPETLGPSAGRLAPCFQRANCVNTGDRYPDGVEPLWLVADSEEAFTRLSEIVAAAPRVRIIVEAYPYLHAEARSRVFRFVDDLELLLVKDGELLVRSASRIGSSDLGVNRRRVEHLREMLEEARLLRSGG